MPSDLVRALAGWAGGLAFIAALIGGFYLLGRSDGTTIERAIWTERQVVAERAARQTEQDLAALAEQSASRIAAKEAALNDQAQRQAAAWRALLARVPRCSIPRAVGVQLDAAAGVSSPAAVAGPPGPGPDDPALDRLVSIADELDTIRTNYAACRVTTGRLIEAREWYEGVRAMVGR